MVFDLYVAHNAGRIDVEPGATDIRFCTTELRDVFVEFGFLCAPGILFEPVARVSIRLRDEAEALATNKAHQKSINGSISLLGVPCSHTRDLGRRIS